MEPMFTSVEAKNTIEQKYGISFAAVNFTFPVDTAAQYIADSICYYFGLPVECASGIRAIVQEGRQDLLIKGKAQ
jgi:hypothetical protein